MIAITWAFRICAKNNMKRVKNTQKSIGTPYILYKMCTYKYKNIQYIMHKCYSISRHPLIQNFLKISCIRIRNIKGRSISLNIMCIKCIFMHLIWCCEANTYLYRAPNSWWVGVFFNLLIRIYWLFFYQIWWILICT